MTDLGQFRTRSVAMGRRTEMARRTDGMRAEDSTAAVCWDVACLREVEQVVMDALERWGVDVMRGAEGGYEAHSRETGAEMDRVTDPVRVALLDLHWWLTEAMGGSGSPRSHSTSWQTPRLSSLP
jgi:hypothetical protein